MKNLTENQLANIEFNLRYDDDNVVHNLRHFGYRVNFWRDILPEKLSHGFTEIEGSGKIAKDFSAGEIVAPYDQQARKQLKRKQFSEKTPAGHFVEPKYGRFYPKGLLQDIPGVYSQNNTPFRCVDVSDTSVAAEFNHPLAQKKLRLTAEIQKVIEKIDERGGTTVNWAEAITDGPGMQSRVNGSPTDFFLRESFAREDEKPDRLFYEKPRFVQHLDQRAREHIEKLYQELVPDGSRVLDLMSSWVSHLPRQLETESVTGVGLNQDELTANPRLTERVVHDLNEMPIMPFEPESFDAAICTASIEYLVRPLPVMREAARVLKKGAPFVITFSNRWFAPKAIRIWSELLEFERMGLVLEYFLASGHFTDLKTNVIRGYPRPTDDKYFPQSRFSDPVYAVHGKKRS